MDQSHNKPAVLSAFKWWMPQCLNPYAIKRQHLSTSYKRAASSFYQEKSAILVTPVGRQPALTLQWTHRVTTHTGYNYWPLVSCCSPLGRRASPNCSTSLGVTELLQRESGVSGNKPDTHFLYEIQRKFNFKHEWECLTKCPRHIWGDQGRRV